MTQRIKAIISVVVFIALLFSAIFACSDFLEYKQASIEYDPFFEAKTNHDVIFLGTSHMYNSILPMELWKEYGIASYNWGYGNCTPAISYYLIQDILKYTSPKVLVLDLYGLIEYEEYTNGKYKTHRVEQQHVQFDKIPLSWNKIRGTQDIFDDYDDNLEFLWNFAMYHNRWSELGKNDFVYETSTEKGASLLVGLTQCNFYPISRDEKMEMDTVCFSYFQKILEYCEQNDVELLCVYLPFAAGTGQQQVSNSVEEIIESYKGCNYVNMLYENIVDTTIDQFDYDHLNYSGACKTTSWLGKYILEHYDVEDYSQNEHWIKDYDAYRQHKTAVLNNQTTLVNNLIALYGNAYDCQLEIFSEKLSESEDILKLAENASVSVTIDIQDAPHAAKLVIRDQDAVVMERIFYDYNQAGFDITKIGS